MAVLVFLVAGISVVLTSFALLPPIGSITLWLAAVLAIKQIWLRKYSWSAKIESWAPFAAFACISIFSADILFRALTTFEVPHSGTLLNHPTAIAALVALATVWIFGKHSALPFLALLLYVFGASAAEYIVTGGKLWGQVSPDNWGQQHVEVGVCLFALQVLVIAAYRVHVSLFIAHAAVLSALLLENLQDWWLSALTVLSIVALLVLINLIVQFFIENTRDLALIWRTSTWATRLEILWRSLWLWLPAIVLVLIGAHIHAALQDEMQSALYRERIVLPRPAIGDSAPRRNIRLDALYTLQQRESTTHQRLNEHLDAAARKGDEAVESLPGEIKAFIEEMRPPLIANGACRGVGVRVAGFRIGLQGFCHLLLDLVDKGIQQAFNRASTKINAAVDRALNKVDEKDEVTIAEVRELGHKEIRRASDEARATINAFFAFLSALQLASALSLAASVLNGFNMVAGRVAFNAKRTPSGESPSTFQLAPGENATLKAVILGDTVHFSSASLAGSDRGWFVYIFTKRSGQDSHLRIRSPQKLSSVLSRLFSLRYWLTWMDTTPENLQKIPEPLRPIGQIAHHSLVAIELLPGQQVVFRVRDLFAFTKDVRLKSVYTTHVGAGILGLGRFYSVAFSNRRATIVLKAFGESAQCLERGNQTSPDSFLAWDRTTKFSVAQELTMAGVWMVPPHLKVQSAGGVLADKRPEGLLTPVFNIWRLLRHLFLPV